MVRLLLIGHINRLSLRGLETWNRCRASLPAGSAPKRIVCLALGSFQSSWQTQMQLLLLQHLVILLNVCLRRPSLRSDSSSCFKVDPSQVSVADPVFEDEDIQYLEKQLFDPRKSSDGFWGPFDGVSTSRFKVRLLMQVTDHLVLHTSWSSMAMRENLDLKHPRYRRWPRVHYRQRLFSLRFVRLHS